jgi:hypothetical protein
LGLGSEIQDLEWKKIKIRAKHPVSAVPTCVPDSVPDPDPPDPQVFGPPGSGSGSTSQRYGSGSGSGSFYHHAKNSKKNLDSLYFVTLFDFLSLKNDVNVPYLQKVISRKNCVKI